MQGQLQRRSFESDWRWENGALLIAACIVAAIRLRGEPIQQSPKVVATISDSVRLAKMGEGRLAVYLVDDPVAWGLPEHIKQRALWLCDACASQMYIRLDRRRHVVRFVRKLPAQNSKTA